METLWMGWDLSTQSVSVLVLDGAGETVYEGQRVFDTDLHEYGTESGCVFGATEETEEAVRRMVRSSPLMWAEAILALLEEMKERSFPFGQEIGRASCRERV